MTLINRALVTGYVRLNNQGVPWCSATMGIKRSVVSHRVSTYGGMTFRKGRGTMAPAVRKIMSRKSRKKTTTANSLADLTLH